MDSILPYHVGAEYLSYFITPPTTTKKKKKQKKKKQTKTKKKIGGKTTGHAHPWWDSNPQSLV